MKNQVLIWMKSSFKDSVGEATWKSFDMQKTTNSFFGLSELFTIAGFFAKRMSKTKVLA